MSDFKIIETQEQLDAIIGERLKREKATVSKEYEGYISPQDHKAALEDFEKKIKELNESLTTANGKIANHSKELAERDMKIKGYETDSVKTRIAHETGLSYDAIQFLKGEDEETIRQSAQSLKNLVGVSAVAPLATTESRSSDATEVALKQTLNGLKGE